MDEELEGNLDEKEEINEETKELMEDYDLEENCLQRLSLCKLIISLIRANSRIVILFPPAHRFTSWTYSREWLNNDNLNL